MSLVLTQKTPYLDPPLRENLELAICHGRREWNEGDAERSSCLIDCRALSVTDAVFGRRLDGDAVAQNALRCRVGVIISPTIAEFGMAGQTGTLGGSAPNYATER
jgi:hypothetical protein